MQISKQDMFCEAMACTANAKPSTNALDFHSHGDDVLGNLFWSVFVDSIDGTVDKDLTIEWQTADAEDFTGAVTVDTRTVDKAGIVQGAYLVKDARLPKGLKRYSRLRFTETSGTKFPTVTAFIHDGRDEGTPFKGL